MNLDWYACFKIVNHIWRSHIIDYFHFHQSNPFSIQFCLRFPIISPVFNNNNNNNNNNDNGRIYNHSLTSLFNNGRLKMSDNLDQQNNGRQHIPYKNLKKTQSNQHLLHGQSLPASSGFDSLSSSSSSSSLSIIIELYIGCHLIMIILLSLWQWI